jgi:hypothetical protein
LQDTRALAAFAPICSTANRRASNPRLIILSCESAIATGRGALILKTNRSALAALLLAFVALPAFADVPGASATTLLPDERDVAPHPLALIAPAALMIALSALGLTITYRSLRDDIRQRRTVYRQRGHQLPDDSVTTASKAPA